MPCCPDRYPCALAALGFSRGWFPWESEGYPHPANMYHSAIPGGISGTWRTCFSYISTICWRRCRRRSAVSPTFSGLRPSGRGGGDRRGSPVRLRCEEAKCRQLAAPMHREAAANFVWRNGLETFFNKGTNGRWRDVLTGGRARDAGAGEGPGDDPGLRRLHGARPQPRSQSS